jgi:hypothetical protein
VARGRERKVGYVEAGDDFHHPPDFFRFAGIDLLYKPVGNGGMKYFSNQRVSFGQIIGVFCPSGYFFPGIDPWYALSYDHRHPYIHIIEAVPKLQFLEQLSWIYRKNRAGRQSDLTGFSKTCSIEPKVRTLRV